MKMGKKVLTLVMSALMIASMGACSARQTTPAATASTGTTASAVSATKKAMKDPYKDKIKIAYVAHDIGTPPNQAWLKGMQMATAYYGNITIQGFDGKSSAETQVKIMQEIINQKYDAIILQASDGAALAPSVTAAEKAGIPVIGLNLDAKAPHAALVEAADYDAGRLVAENMVKQFNGKGNFAIIQGLQGLSRTDNLEKGFRDTLAKHPDMKIVAAQPADFQKEKAMSVMNSFLQTNSKIDGVFAVNDAMAEGAALAADSAGRLKGMAIWGADGEKDALNMIEKGQLTGTIYTNYYDEGSTAAKLAIYCIGSPFDTSTITKTPIVNMEPVVATKDTVGSIQPSDRW